MFRRQKVTSITALLAVSAGVFFACSESTSPDHSGTFFGASTAMATGSGRAYVTLDRAGQPTDLGVALTEAALIGLPAVLTEFVFALPTEASATAFKVAAINWQPQGHPPMNIFTVPHFDVHFYTITQAQRDAINPATEPQFATKMLRLPAATFVPAGYVADTQGFPRMGLHWGDPTAPEKNGHVFSKTFIYGSYDGAFIFAEPMLTKLYLESKPAAVATPVKLPAQYAASGYQPTSYTVSYDTAAKEYRIALTGLTLR
ncbi:MAG: DUF5602 domain-containing protein [Gemmatimonadaceae bacterium]|nr:DUF5602 domain-containing protein [Gemmatimonadaceae bacterium]